MANNENLFSSLVSDIKNYNGTDPLVLWLRGIKKMTDALPPELLTQKLPRFLKKCAITFREDHWYRNDSRYLRVWIKLLDFVDDPGAVLKNMKANNIGDKRSLFYQAYALYYEKKKKYTEAENNYLSGFIPTEIGNLSKLQTLDFSSNSLSGSIPTSLENLRNLSIFNVSNNFLARPVPSDGALGQFGTNS